MQYDELHSKLFALAKKGTQDETFVVRTTSGYNSGRTRVQSKLKDKKNKVSFSDNVNPDSHRRVQNLKNLQFTLFD